MNTPTHFLLTAALGKPLKQQGLNPIRSAWWWGSIAPDIPLYLLTLGGWVYYCLILGWDPTEAFRYMFRELFFHNPFWIASHNVLHSPTLLLIGWGWNGGVQGSPWVRWFLSACLLHTLVDIPVHVTDGPLLFFPFNWSFRWRGPVSYWDPRYGGDWFFWVELALNGLLLIYLAWPWLRRGLRGRAQLTEINK